MNAIQKFKKNRMIPKAAGGQRFQLAGNSTMGFPVWADTETGHLYTADIAGRRDPNKDYGTSDWNQWKDEGTGLGYFSGLSAGYINGSDWIRKPAAKKNPNGTVVNDKKQASNLQKEQQATGKQGVTGKVGTKRTPINWGNKFNDFVGGLSEEQQGWLRDNGLNDATKLQDYLTNMGFSVGKFGSDGKFGNDSRAAWDKFAASGIMGKNRDQEIYEEKQKELVLDAEDPFGYRTDNHYGDGAALKNMGFSNYAGLQKFAAGDDQFAKDLRQRFGQDVSKWDQAAVEGALGVSGRYRGSMGGDFGDMARSMQQWAAQQNAAYDTKEQASRTDSSGTVYSNSKLAQLFDKAGKSVEANRFKLQPPVLNFNLKQGNIGAATLGNIQTLDPSNMSPREIFAMG